MIIQNTLSTLPAATPEVRNQGNEVGNKPAVATEAPKKAEPSRQQLGDAVDNINRSLQSANHNLRFSIDDTSDRVVIKVVDEKTGETVRQIPAKEALAIAESIDRYQDALKKGLILEQQA